MPQKRSKTGVSFERDLVENYGYVIEPKDPKMCWIIDGKTYSNSFKASILADCDPDRIKLDILGSSFEKRDGYKIISPLKKQYSEIKRYLIEECNSWKMFSEPFLSVKTKGQIEFIIANKNLENIQNRYNNLIDHLLEEYGDEVLSNFVDKCTNGIQLIDGFLPKDQIEFRLYKSKGWRGFKRVEVQFRIKPGEDINPDPLIAPTLVVALPKHKSKSNIDDTSTILPKTKKRQKSDYILTIKKIIDKNIKNESLERILLEQKIIFKEENLPDRVKKEKRSIEIVINGNTYYSHTKDSNDIKSRKIKRALEILNNEL